MWAMFVEKESNLKKQKSFYEIIIKKKENYIGNSCSYQDIRENWRAEDHKREKIWFRKSTC